MSKIISAKRVDDNGKPIYDKIIGEKSESSQEKQSLRRYTYAEMAEHMRSLYSDKDCFEFKVLTEAIKLFKEEEPLLDGKIPTDEEIVKRVLNKTLDKMVEHKFESLRGTYRIDDFSEEQKITKKKELRNELKRYYIWFIQVMIPEFEEELQLKNNQFKALMDRPLPKNIRAKNGKIIKKQR